jgi:hypothetical protein
MTTLPADVLARLRATSGVPPVEAVDAASRAYLDTQAWNIRTPARHAHRGAIYAALTAALPYLGQPLDDPTEAALAGVRAAVLVLCERAATNGHHELAARLRDVTTDLVEAEAEARRVTQPGETASPPNSRACP